MGLAYLIMVTFYFDFISVSSHTFFCLKLLSNKELLETQEKFGAFHVAISFPTRCLSGGCR